MTLEAFLKIVEIGGARNTTMQEKQRTNDQKNHLRPLPSHERYLVAEIKKAFQALTNSSPEQIEQLILTIPAQCREAAIRLAAQQFVYSMTLHLLQLATTFHQHAEEENMDEDERDETLRDVKENITAILELNRVLEIDSVESLHKLGTITMSIIDLSHFSTAEEAQSTLYALPGIYEGWLERAHLFKKEQPA
jgi:hypothetical protein